MLIPFRIFLIIVLLIVLIRLKVNLAIALIIDAVCAGVLFRLEFFILLKTLPLTFIQTTTLEFLFIIYMVLLLGNLMKESGNLTNLIRALENIFRDYRIGVAVMPALIGLLPMPAGAMLSAPVVKEFGEKSNLDVAKMTYINFWFRHIWEYFWPLYPGIILSSGIFNVAVRDIMIAQFPLTIFAIVAGMFFMFRLPKIDNDRARSKFMHLWRIVFYMWPIIIVIMLVLFAKFRMSWALGISVLTAIIFFRLTIKKLFIILKKAFSLSTLGVIYSVFLFKNIMESSDALKVIPEISSGFPLLQILIIFLAPFIVGLLTGVNSAFVGITFPVIAPLFGSGEVNLSYLMFAYASGFAGVMLSPVHLCLCLTKEYYGAEFSQVYKYLLPSVFFVFAGAVILFLLKIV